MIASEIKRQHATVVIRFLFGPIHALAQNVCEWDAHLQAVVEARMVWAMSLWTFKSSSSYLGSALV